MPSLPARREGDVDAPAAVHRVAGVLDQVLQHLFEQGRAGPGLGQTRGDVDRELDAAGEAGVVEEGQAFGDEEADVHRLQAGALAAREGEQVGGDCLAAVGLLLDGRQSAAQLREPPVVAERRAFVEQGLEPSA